MKLYKMFFLCFCLLAIYEISAAASGVVELEPIVVTPYRSAVAAGLNSSSTDVIYVEEAQKEGKYTFIEAIKNIPSLSHATTGGLGGDTAIFIRGANSAHTQVMLDGIKLYDPISTSGYFYAYNYMALDNIERIEVAKGPYSSLYGSDSIGGTINLIPRRGKGEPSFSYFQEGGSYDTLRGMFSAQGEVDKLSYSLATSWTNVKGFYSLRKDEHPKKDPYRDLNSSLNLQYSLTDSIELGLITNYTYAKHSYDGDTGFPDYLPADADNYARFYQGIGGVNFKHQISDIFMHKATLGYTHTYRKGLEESFNNHWYRGKTYQAKWQGDYQILPENKIIFGFDYAREEGGSYRELNGFFSAFPKKTANTKGYYIENLFNPWDNLLFSASYRREEHSHFGGENTLGFGASYLIEETGTKLKSSFGQGFKSPALYQFYDSSIGNLALTPEKSRSFEGGFEQDIGKKLKFGTTYFQTNIKDLIDWDWTGPNLWDGNYQNIGKAKIYGLENFLKYRVNDYTHFTVEHTFQEARERPSEFRLLRRPRSKTTCVFKTAWHNLDIYSELSYIGNRIDWGDVKLKSYLLANMNLNYKVNDNLDLSLKLENILDKDYELVKGYQTSRFAWYAGARISF